MAKSPIRKMTLGEIRRKSKAGGLTETEVRRIFVAVDNVDGKFGPAVAFDPAHVDFTGFRAEPGEAEALLEKAGKRAEAASKAAKKGLESTKALKAKKKVLVLAEGDSWFNLPWLIKPKTAMDFLDETHDVNNLAHWGDVLEDMVAAPAYAGPLGSGKYRHFFLSGGGNDVLDGIESYVSKRKDGDTDPANAALYIKPSFGKALIKLIELYAAVAAATPVNTILYIHGYAHARPLKNGPYLGTPLKKQGFDAIEHADLAQAVIRHMVDMFNAALSGFAASRARVVYIDLRPVVKAKDWHTDEIHPSSGGAAKIADAFRAAIAANIPGA